MDTFFLLGSGDSLPDGVVEAKSTDPLKVLDEGDGPTVEGLASRPGQPVAVEGFTEEVIALRKIGVLSILNGNDDLLHMATILH